MTRTILHIVGARPQFVKYFAVSSALKRLSGVTDILVHTGQHYDYSMSKIFFDELGIKEPEYHLEVGSGNHGEQTAKILERVEETLLKVKPSIVMVYGDTNSTLGGALAAAKLQIPVAHVEAGLRSYNRSMPEEINRIAADRLSTILFCPSATAVASLKKEGFANILFNGTLLPEGTDENSLGSWRMDVNKPLVVNVGDVMYDVLLRVSTIAEKRSTILDTLHVAPKNYFLFTLHRAENTDNEDHFHEIIRFVNKVSDGTTVIFPMHPRTKKVYERNKKEFGGNIRIIEPAGYFDLLTLLKNSSLLLTDSGGMQKEAFWLRTQCVTLRKETEWVETLEDGWNTLYKNFRGRSSPPNRQSPFYGDGRAAEKITRVLHSLI
ncbi:MAG: UDP-N-acetyl glucosamine 2-epimerase [Bacteroidota bacterium]